MERDNKRGKEWVNHVWSGRLKSISILLYKIISKLDIENFGVIPSNLLLVCLFQDQAECCNPHCSTPSYSTVFVILLEIL